MSNADSFLDGFYKEISIASGTIAMGLLGNDCGNNYVEGFFKVETEKDLPRMRAMTMRARFNSHRNMRMFYFKTGEFESLHKIFMDDNEDFADWVVESKSIKKEYL